MQRISTDSKRLMPSGGSWRRRIPSGILSAAFEVGPEGAEGGEGATPIDFDPNAE